MIQFQSGKTVTYQFSINGIEMYWCLNRSRKSLELHIPVLLADLPGSRIFQSGSINLQTGQYCRSAIVGSCGP
jgi:hypothetical protein